MPEHDARRAYDVWLRLIADEELYRALLAGRHAQVAASRGLEAADVAVLDDFAARPGTRWNMENLRFRAAVELAAKLKIWLPRTVALLTLGNDDWLQDICSEYLAFHQWQECGHFQLTEVARFGDFVRERVMPRRRTPAGLEPVLAFECAVAALVKSTAALTDSSWPPLPAPRQAIESLHPRHAPAVSVVALPLDITDWIRSGDPSQGTLRDGPVTLLLFVPSLREKHRIQVLSEGPRAVYERCTGEASAGEIARRLHDDAGLEPADTVALIGRWLEQRALVA